MDVDVVLNACLETHRNSELQRAKERLEVITSSMITRLFNNGEVICDITELTMSQSRPLVPVYSMGSEMSVFTLPGKNEITGTFCTKIDDPLILSSEDDPEYNEDFHIETDQLFSDGTSSRVRILGVSILECSTERRKVSYTFTATNIDLINLKK